MSGLRTDAGGGDARGGLGNKTHELRRTCSIDALLTTAYSHHGFNLVIASPCEKHFGDGGVSNCNLLQLLHACCAM